jgi:hypothetical protein
MGIFLFSAKNESTNYLMKTRQDASFFEKQAVVAAGFPYRGVQNETCGMASDRVTAGQIA